MNSFRRLALATTVTTLVVIGVGALVRATGSGDGCPDWPRCFGRWIPPLEYHALVEYSHRTVGAIAIAMLCTTAVVAVRRHRAERAILWPTLVATSTIFIQAALGAIVVTVKSDPDLARFEAGLVTLHIATALLLIGMLVSVTVRAFIPAPPGGAVRAPLHPSTARWLRAAALGVIPVILLGAYVRGRHAGLAFTDFPLMAGRAIPPSLAGDFGIHFLHRAAATAFGVVLAVFAVKAWRLRPVDGAVKRFAAIAGAVYLAQVLVGGAQVWTRLAVAPVVAHVVLATLIWATLIAAWATSRRLVAAHAGADRPVRAEPAPISGGQVGMPAQVLEQRAPLVRPASGLRDVVAAYVQLTKPRIITLLLITTVPSMALAARGMPSGWLVLATLAGGTLASASANTINCYVDRDIDSLMRRTRNRPLPAQRIEPRHALAFGIALAAASLGLMLATVNLPAALLAQAAILFYVFVYTLALKRSTPQNIVIGGAAGAVPCLVGWAAVTGRVGAAAWVLFAIVFTWTPPHFWALAMRYAADYRAAGVPMLPVVRGERATVRSIAGYAVLTVAVTFVLWPVGGMGPPYVVAAALLGAWFVRDAWRLLRAPGDRVAMRLFRTSITYLGLLFAAVALDAVVRGAPS